MILYRKKWNGLLLLLQLQSSSGARAVLPALLSCFVAGLLEWRSAGGTHSWPGVDDAMDHPYPFQVFAFTLGFAIVFRTNFAYQRYWTAVQFTTTMTSKWGDVALQLSSFDTCLSNRDTDGERQVFRLEMVHLVSLLHGVALQSLRADTNLSNLVEFDPSAIGLSTTGFPSPVIGHTIQHVGQQYRDAGGSSWSCSALQPCTLARKSGDIQRYYQLNPIHVLGGVSDEERNALQAVDAHTRIFLVMQWLTDCVVLQGKAKWFEVEGPIVSRIYQELSDGMLGYNQARKVTDVPFPFPYAQLVMILLSIYCVTVPVIMAAWLEGYWMVCGLTFIAVWSYFAVNEVNRDLEDPFLYDPNDLPLTAFQADLNLRLQSLDARHRSNRLTATKQRTLGDTVQRTFKCGPVDLPRGEGESKHTAVKDVFTPMELEVARQPPGNAV